ncbi:hypothetical protein [Streptomyces sp. NPDC045470]|uniref:hypothetical protein n=1 Tax=Streptomyces sp. NPDC045470 TaxID=3155469 RepID=UPI0033F796C1
MNNALRSATASTGHDRELVRSYPYRSACPSDVWGELIGGRELLFAGYTNYFLWSQVPAFSETLRQKAGEGCRGAVPGR